MLCSGDIPDFSPGPIDNSLLSSLFGDLSARSATGDEELDWPPFDACDLLCRDGDAE